MFECGAVLPLPSTTLDDFEKIENKKKKKKEMAVELVPTKSFQQLWKQLRKLGWTAKKPTGLGVDFRYVPPSSSGGSVSGEEERNVFTGEDALMTFARRRRLLAVGLELTAALVDAALADPFTFMREAPRVRAPAQVVPAITPAPELASLPQPSVSPAQSEATPPPRADPQPSASTPMVPEGNVMPAPATRAPSDGPPPRRHYKTTLRVHERQASAMSSGTAEASAAQDAGTAGDTAQASTTQATGTAGDTAQVPSTAEDSTAQDTRTARDTAVPSATAQANTAEESSTAEDTAEDDLTVYDSPDFLRAMQEEDYFDDVSSDDVNWCAEPTDDDDDAISDIEDDNAIDMLFDAYDDEETGPEVEDDGADTCAIDDDKEVLREMSMNGWEIFDETKSQTCLRPAASDYFEGRPRPTKSAQAFADCPLGLFFYFLPKVMWAKIAEESNRYRADSVEAMARERQRQQRERHAADPNVPVQSLQEILKELEKWKLIQPHELVKVVGLLLARALCLQRVALHRHWSTKEEGAVPRGTFGPVMSRNRFQDIVRFLHFNSNADDNRLRDRAWKVRPVLQVAEKTFRRGFLLGKTIRLDEGMVGSRHRMNPMRVYMKGKPTKWGTKFYMTCCAETAYCAHVEICCRGEETDNTITRAVIRNVSKALQGLPAKRLVVTDNYDSSITLSQELLKRGLYHVGTYRMNRLGWPAKGFSYNFTTRPKKIPRGTYRIAVNKTNPEIVAVSWCDSHSVQLIASGCSTMPTTITRREKNGTVADVVCPQLVVDYQKGMGGVDQHDQLRLHRYSIQKSMRMLKYYKGVFLGIVDMTIVNGYIIHRFERQAQGKPVPTHAEYIIRLHQELIAVTKLDMASHLVAENLVSAPVLASAHRLSQTTEVYKGQLRQYMCKVCSALSDKKQRSFETSFGCETCACAKGGSVWLCNKVRPGQTLTCSQIWHENWKNGTLIPAELRGRIRFCKRKLVNADVSESGESSE